MKLYYLCPNTMENIRQMSLKINFGVFQHQYRAGFDVHAKKI